MLQPLSIVWDFDPVFFSIGSFDIRYYGVMWALAILIGAKLFDNFVKREGLPSSVSESIFIYGTLATIIGARLGHCLFYDPVEYLRQPWTIITGFRDGGLASHGAAVGLLIGLWLFSRRNRLPYIWSLDRIMIAVGIGGAVVRLGNLFNSEIFGGAVLPGNLRNPLLALLRARHGATPSRRALRHRADRRLPHALLHRVHQGAGLGARHGTVAQHPLHPVGLLHDLPGLLASRGRARRGQAGGAADSRAPQKEQKETMTQYPMVDQVNRLAGNLLAAGGELYLPGVGSLCVRFRGARRLSARLVEPPSREVVFTSQQRGVSLVDEIARVLRTSAPAEGPQAGGEHVAAQAQDIYDRWLMRTRQDDVLTIEGVRINPQGHAPVRIHRPRRFDGAMWIGIAAIVFVVAFTAYWWLDNRHAAPTVTTGSESVTLVAAAPAATEHSAAAEASADGVGADSVTDPAAAGTASAVSGAEGAAQDAAPALRAEAPADTAPAADGEPARLVSGRRYVVLGVFSTPENAARAAQLAREKEGSFRCGVYRFGAKFMVSPFESEDAEACTLFIRAHAETFPGMWTYTAR